MKLQRLIAAPILALSLSATAAGAAGEAPQIASAAINPDPVHPGDHVAVVVQTTPDVVAVDARVRAYHFSLTQTQPGRFETSGVVPKIARFFKGTYHVTFTAHCAGGATVESGTDVVLN